MHKSNLLCRTKLRGNDFNELSSRKAPKNDASCGHFASNLCPTFQGKARPDCQSDFEPCGDDMPVLAADSTLHLLVMLLVVLYIGIRVLGRK